MGFLDKKVQAGRDRQKQALIAEASKAGGQVLEIVELDAGAAQAGSVVGGSLSAIFGGRLKTDGIQIYRLSTQGWPHVYVQPFSGFNPLPGEHHGSLHGALGSPAIARANLRYSDHPFDPALGLEVARHLASAPAIRAVLKDIVWDWPMGMGKVELDWAVQLRSAGDGTTHVVMQSGRYGGFTTYEVGFSVWWRLCGAIHGCLGQWAVPAQHFPIPVRFAELVMLVMGAPAQPSAPTQPVGGQGVDVQLDYREVIAQALGPHVGNKVWLGEGPAKKMANIREHVIPGHFAGVPVLAAIDLTTFGSAKDAIVVTPTHLLTKEFDEQLCLELAAIQAVPEGQRTIAGHVEIVVDRLGSVRIPVGIDFEPVHALLAAIAQANGDATGLHAKVSAFVGEAPGQVSLAEAQELAVQVQRAMATGAVDDKINAAAKLLLASQYQASIDAYLEIARVHPERTGTCYGQIGAGLFFIRQYERAIEYYEAAKQHGANPRMMDENIAEARAALAG